MRKNYALIVRWAGLLSALAVLAFAPAASAQTATGPAASTAPPATTPAPSTQSLKDWRAGMVQVPPPKMGCFTVSHPSTEWQEVPCTTPPPFPYGPARGSRPASVGNGTDVSAQVSTYYMGAATGSFDSVTGVTSESGNNPYTNTTLPNTFTLQLNSNTFTTPTCNGTAGCLGWEQFVFANDNTNTSVFIQYWLLNYNATCPSGWITAGSDCYKNAPIAVPVPQQTIANLVNLSFTGSANLNVNGILTDQSLLQVGSTLYSMQNADSVLDLSAGWLEAEFNIFGDADSASANFNAGSTIVVRTSVYNDLTTAPSCFAAGFTGETNNLSFAGIPAAQKDKWPAIVFTESTAGGAASPCASTTEVSESTVTLTATPSALTKVYQDYYQTNVASGGTAPYTYAVIAGAVPSGVDFSSAGGWLQGLPTVAGAFSYTIKATDSSSPQNTATVAVSGTIASGAPVTLTAAASAKTQVGQPYSQTNVASGGQAPYTYGFNSGALPAGTSLNTSTGTVSGTPTTAGPFSYSIDVLDYNIASATAASSGTIAPAATHDFNGDSKSDILWHDTSGDVAMWLMNGLALSSGGVIATVPNVWSIVGTGDFNGDGKGDILWRNTSGDVAMWLMNGTALLSGGGIGTVAPSSGWTIVGTGDFNGDGKGDILWRNTLSGDVDIWLMNGTALISGTDIGNVSPSSGWTIAGTGDFNGDGKSDILWRNTTSGDVAIWLMSGTQIITGGDFGNVPLSSGWTIVGTGDFNGDGKADILWRDTAGDVAIWLMNGMQLISGTVIGNVAPSYGWSIVGTGDFNGDGKSDILWRHSGGDVAIWLMNGTQIISETDIGSVPVSWAIQSAGAD